MISRGCEKPNSCKCRCVKARAKSMVVAGLERCIASLISHTEEHLVIDLILRESLRNQSLHTGSAESFKSHFQSWQRFLGHCYCFRFLVFQCYIRQRHSVSRKNARISRYNDSIDSKIPCHSDSVLAPSTTKAVPSCDVKSESHDPHSTF